MSNINSPHTSAGEQSFDTARIALTGISMVGNAALPSIASLPHLAQATATQASTSAVTPLFPSLGVWSKEYFQTFVASFFLVNLTIDLIKIAWQTLSLIYAHNVNLEKSAELAFNIAKAALICILLFGAAILTATAALVLMSIMLGIDPLLNCLKSLGFLIRCFVEEDETRKEFFYDKTIESVKHTLISGTVAAILVTFIMLPIVIPVAVSITAAVIGGLALAIPALTIISKAVYVVGRKLHKWLGNAKPKDKARFDYSLKNKKNIFDDQPLNLNDDDKIIELDDLASVQIKKSSSWDYHEHVVTPDIAYSELGKHLQSHIDNLKKIPHSNFLGCFQQKKRDDKTQALIALQDILRQWNNTIKDGETLCFNTINSESYPISNIKSLDNFFSVAMQNKPKEVTQLKQFKNFLSDKNPNTFENMGEKKFTKQTDRLLKLVKEKILESYPKAFQSWQYKGKVESLFDQTFASMKTQAMQEFNNYKNKENTSDSDQLLIMKVTT